MSEPVGGDAVAAIVLAAGRGTRFADGPKMLAKLHGTPLVRHVVDNALAAGLEPVLIVTGHEAEAVAASLAGVAANRPERDLVLISNPAFRDGLSTSLRAGFEALPAETAAAVILLGDMPGIGPDLLRHLLWAWHAAAGGGAVALVPTHGGRRGNPVILSRTLGPEIAALRGDVGAGPLLRGRADVVEAAVDDPATLLDLDTAEALARYASTTSCRTAT